MFKPPKSLLSVGAGYLTARTARRLKDPRRAGIAQKKALGELTSQFARTQFGRNHGIEPDMSYERFRARVALRDYAALEPRIEEMKRGERDILWPGRCSLFATSSGTSGQRKFLPVTEPLLAHFRQCALESILYYTARTKHAGAFQGRHLLLSENPNLDRLRAGAEAAYAGDLTAIGLLNLPDWVEQHIYEPGLEIARISDPQAKIKAILDRVVGRDITLIGGLPTWILAVADALRQRTPPAPDQPFPLSRIWPNLEVFVHGGLPIDPFLSELRAYAGHTVRFQEIYVASEAFIAAQDMENPGGLRLMAASGVFFEFLPLKLYSPPDLASLGGRAVPLEEVVVGVDYVVLLTTPGGLCRYLLEDVVRFLSTDVPRLVYVGKTNLRLNSLGEQTMEADLTAALAESCRRHNWRLTSFHVAPILFESAVGRARGRHEWWIELKAPCLETPIGSQIAGELDQYLLAHCESYAEKRSSGILLAPVVRLVAPGVFDAWMRAKGSSHALNRTPRCRSDRTDADQLAELTRFYGEAG